MKKLLYTLTLLTHFTLAATPEQIEQYLSVSNSEEELLSLQSQFSSMQNSFKSQENNASDDNTYDMQMLSIRFKEYLQSHLSDDEMTEILQNYANVVLLQFIAAESEAQAHDRTEISTYVQTLKNNPESAIRIELVSKISKALYSKEAMVVMFDELMKPLMENGIGGQKMDAKMLKGVRENYLKMMIEASKRETLYASKDFTMEELEELLKVAQTPAIEHETKAAFGAMAYALKEFFMSLTSRFDVSKHQPKGTEKIKHTK